MTHTTTVIAIFVVVIAVAGIYYYTGGGLPSSRLVVSTVSSTSTSSTLAASTASCPALLTGLNVTITHYDSEGGNVTVLVRNNNSFAVTFWGIDPEPYYGVTIHVNQTVVSSSSMAFQLNNPVFQGIRIGFMNQYNFYFILAGANEQALVEQRGLCIAHIKLVSTSSSG